jgi:hypothetical protein
VMGVQMERITHFDERADKVWWSASPHYPVIMRRDRAFLQWRYADFPRAGYYQCFAFQSRGTPVGWAVLKLDKHNGLDSGFIVDFLCEPRWQLPLLSRCVSYLAAQGALAVYCALAGNHASRALHTAGFLKRDTGWPFMAQVDRLTERERRMVSEPGQWFLTWGDSNVDQPREGLVYAA